MSSTREMRSRSLRSMRTSGVASVVPIAYSWPRTVVSVVMPCSVSMTSQSNPARAHASATTGEPVDSQVPNVVAPPSTRSRRVVMWR